jgi:hypothetical protein|tara:strand:- start:201 stop:377 length:177 start_codon:yes stop_codon:yes gene_type:complete
MKVSVFNIEFQDFTEIGGIGCYQVSVKASSIEDAERKVQATFASAWDVRPKQVEQINQ